MVKSIPFRYFSSSDFASNTSFQQKLASSQSTFRCNSKSSLGCVGKNASRISHFNKSSASNQSPNTLKQNCGCYTPSATQPYSYNCDQTISNTGCPGNSGLNTVPYFDSSTSTCWLYKILNYGQPNQTFVMNPTTVNYLWPVTNLCPQ